jgi:hypothetical protein
MVSVLVKQSSRKRPRYIALSATQAVLHCLIKEYLNERSTVWESKIFDLMENYYIKNSPHERCRQEDTETALAQLLSDKLIVEVVGGCCHFLHYKLSENITKDYATVSDFFAANHCSIYIPIPQQTEAKLEPERTERLTHLYLQEKNNQRLIAKAKQSNHSVYYIQWLSNPSFVKIGYSSSPKSRFLSFLTGNPGKLKIIRLEPVNCASDETARHIAFDEYRHTREWFRYEGTLKQYIQSLSVEPAVHLWNQLSQSSQREIEVEFF